MALTAYIVLAFWLIATAVAIAEKEPVFGIELTMDGAHAAVSLLSGGLQHIAFAQGDRDYQELMTERSNLSIGLMVDHTNRSLLIERVQAVFPQPSKEHENEVRRSWDDFWSGMHSSWMDWTMWKLSWQRLNVRQLYALDLYQGDKATKILAHIVLELHDIALHEVAAIEEVSMPIVDIALPSWFLIKTPELADDSKLRDGRLIVSTSHLEHLTPRNSSTLHRFGFQLSASSDVSEIRFEHDKGMRGGPRLGRPWPAVQFIHSHSEVSESAGRSTEDTKEIDKGYPVPIGKE